MRILLPLLLLCLSGQYITAQLTVDFTGFDGSGVSAPVPNGEAIIAGQLNGSTFSFQGVEDPSFLARGTASGAVAPEGVYAFDVGGGNIALGIQPRNSTFLPGSITLTLYNQTGMDILPSDAISVSYDIYEFNNQGGTNSFNFSYSTDGTNFTPLPDLDFATVRPGDGGATVWVSTPRAATFSGVSVANDDPFFIRFSTERIAGGNADQIAVDEISLSFFSILPVELTTLSAQPMPKSVMVKWATASEDGSDFFAVERSADAGRNFTEIGQVRAAGDSRDEQRYELEDLTPVKGQTLYRLRAVDLDGSFEYSDQVVVEFAGTAGISVFPNPVSTELKVAGLDATASEATLITATGSQRMVPVTNGNVDVSLLRSGVYFLRVAGNDAPVRFVKR